MKTRKVLGIRFYLRSIRPFIAVIALGLACFNSALSQTSTFTLQGKLNVAGTPASGVFDMRFRLFGSEVGSDQIGSTITISSISAVAGIFTTQLDFSSAAFSGADRWVEISISPAGQDNFVTLSPRQKVMSSPYSIQSFKASTADDALNLGGVPASHYVLTGDSRLSDVRIPLPGSNDYVQNKLNSPQLGVNFNIGGTGSANILNAQAQFNLGGGRILSNPGLNNLFAGIGAGSSNSAGVSNSFFGRAAGGANTTGNFNSFFGESAGGSNTVGQGNSFFGIAAGAKNVVGINNTFVGNSADFDAINLTGHGNTLLGAITRVSSGVTQSTAIGYGAEVTQSQSIVLGATNTNVGIGTSAPGARLHIKGASEGVRIEGSAPGAQNGAYVSFADSTGIPVGYVGDGSSGDKSLYLTSYVADVNLYTPVGAVLTATSTGNVSMRGGPALPLNTAAQVFDNNNGPFKGIVARSIFMDATGGNGFDSFLGSPVHVCARIENLGVGFGGYALVRCTTPFSSAEKKTNIRPFSDGLNIIRQLEPVSFSWKKGGGDDVGLNAEDVAVVAPMLVSRNEKGEVEEVKDRALNLVLINAIKEQQAQIEAQRKQIEALKKIVCESTPQLEACSEKDHPK